MSGESKPTSDVTANTDQPLPKPKRWWRNPWWFLSPFWLCFVSFWFGFETLLLRNIPMLILMIAIIGGMWFIPQLATWRLGKLEKDKRQHLKAFGHVGLIMCGWLLYFCVISLFMRYCVPYVVISPETTHVTRPLNDEGFIDVIAALEERFAAKCKPEDNGFRFLLERFGMVEMYRDSSPEQQKFFGGILNEMLAIPGHNVPDAVYQSPYQFFEERFKADENTDDDAEQAVSLSDRLNEKMNPLFERPWDGAAMLEMAEWFAANNKALDLFGEAVRFPDYYAPIVRENKRTLLRELSDFDLRFARELVYGLQCRVMHSLTIGDTDLAIHDAMTIARLADARMRHATSDFHFATAVGFREKAELAFIDIIRHGDLSSEQLIRLRDERQLHDFLMPVSDLVFQTRMRLMQIQFEMMAFLPDFLTLQSSPPSTYETTMYFWVAPLLKTTVWTPVLKDLQKKFDAWDEIATQPPGKRQIEAFSSQYQRHEMASNLHGNMMTLVQQYMWKGQAVTAFQIISDFNLSLEYPLFLSAVTAHYKTATRSRLLNIAIALELYKHDHRHYPASLDELAEKYLATIPDDPFTDGEPFHYRLEPQTTTDSHDATDSHEPQPGYLLYSVGSNGRDDDGVSGDDWHPQPADEEPAEAEPLPTGDDIRIRMPRERLPQKITGQDREVYFFRQE